MSTCRPISWRPGVALGDGYESSLPVVWSLQVADAGLLTIDRTGTVNFIAPPDFESGKKTYEFTVKAVAVGGQLMDEQAVTISIQDVDDNAPSEMLVIDIHEDRLFTPADFQDKAARKLAKIRFKDVDSQAGNMVEIDSDSAAFFEIRPAQQAHKVGVYRLWVKDGVELAEGEYNITITPVINGVRRQDMQETFTFTVDMPKQLPDNPSRPDGNMQSTPVPEDAGTLWEPDSVAPLALEML